MNLKFHQTYWLSIITLFEKLIPLILLPVLLNDLGLGDYGILYLILTIVNFFLPVFSFGFNLFFSKEYSKKNENIFTKIFSNFLLIQFFFFLIITLIIFLLMFLNLLSINFFDLIILLLLPSSRVLNLAVKEIFRIKQQIKQSAIIVLFIFIIDLTITLVLLKIFDFGYKSRIYGTSLALFLTSFFSLLYLRKYIYLKINRYYLFKWFLFGKKIIQYRIFGFILNQGNRFVIQFFLGEIYLGIYMVSLQIASPFLIIMKAFSSGWNSFIYNFLKIRSININFLLKVNILFFLFLTGVLIFHQYITYNYFTLFIKSVDLDTVLIFQLLICVAYIFQNLYNIVFPIVIYKGNQGFISKISLHLSSLNIFLNVFLIYYFESIIVACILFLINWMIMYSLTLIKTYKLIKSNS